MTANETWDEIGCVGVATTMETDNEDEPPPEPAPPEVPPRGLSMHTLKKRQLVIDKLSGDQTHEEFIPSIKSGKFGCIYT